MIYSDLYDLYKKNNHKMKIIIYKIISHFVISQLKTFGNKKLNSLVVYFFNLVIFHRLLK